MGDVTRGMWYDIDGNRKKHWRWDKILPTALSVVAVIISAVSLAVALCK